jgi:tRNA A-37 threonylcarbamoyl transferase component Bud32
MTVDSTLGVPNLVDVELLGSGGFSVVYSATHTVFDRRVAVKVLTSIATEADRRRFEQECRAMGRLSGNPNVVTVYQADYTTTNRPYLIMELIQGGSLADHLARVRRLRWDQAVDIMLPVCGAVQHAHREGVLHRDIKPDNILLDNGVPKLADFGIARLRGAGGQTSTHVSASWFHTPPETFNQARDERSDLYALASTLYTAVRGHPPLWRDGDDSVYPLVQRLMTEDAPPLPPELGPPDLSRFLQRALAREPDHRPQTAQEFAAELAAIRGVSRAPITAAPNVPGDRTRALGGYLFATGPARETGPSPTGLPDPHGATATLGIAGTGNLPAGGGTGTQVIDHRVHEVAKAAMAPALPTATGRPTPRHRSQRTTAALIVAVVLLGAVSAAGTWLLLDRANQTAASAPGTSDIDLTDAAGPGRPTDSRGAAQTTTAPDADADGMPDAQDACPDQPGVSSGLGCPDADADTVPDAEDACPLDPGAAADAGCPVSQVTIELVRFHVVADCDDGFLTGDGEFTLRASAAHNGTGTEEELTAFEDSYKLSNGAEAAIGESATFVIARQPGKEFRVDFHSEEEDGFPDPPLDERLGPGGQGAATNRHQWVAPEGWTNLDRSGAYTLVTGTDSDACQVELDYRLTIE